MASALVFVYVSGWCLARLSAMGAPSLAGIIYVGPGLGIAVSGLAATAMVAHGVRAATGWAVSALLALVLTALAWPQLQGAVQVSSATSLKAEHPPRSTVAAFTLAYGLAGFGYIITATFLRVIARQALPGSVWLDLFWPLFGLGVSIGALLTIRLPVHWDRRHLLMACYGTQATGVLCSVWWPTLVGLALGSLLLGLPFTAITLFAMQEARRLCGFGPHGSADSSLRLRTDRGASSGGLDAGSRRQRGGGFALSLQTAAVALLLGLAIYATLARRRSVRT